MTINSSTGVIAGTLASESAGAYTVTLTISDGIENVSVGFTWTVTNPTPGAHQYVRFVADAEVNGQPWTSMAELNVLDATGTPFSQASWSVVSFDSQETVGEDGQAANAIDGNPQTFWHTEWFANDGEANDPAHPHEIVINLGARYDLGGFTYLPRPGGGNGTVSAYRFYVSTDGANRGSPVAQGTFVNNANEKTILFVPPPGN